MRTWQKELVFGEDTKRPYLTTQQKCLYSARSASVREAGCARQGILGSASEVGSTGARPKCWAFATTWKEKKEEEKPAAQGEGLGDTGRKAIPGILRGGGGSGEDSGEVKGGCCGPRVLLLETRKGFAFF